MKHIKTFESFSYSENEIIKEEFFGFGKPKDGEWTKNIEDNFKLLKDGKLSKTSLEKRFGEYGGSFGFDGQNAINFAGKQALSVYNYLYKDGKVEDVKEEEFAKVHINRCKAVIKNEKGEWIDDSLVGDGLTPGRKM
jgi:hypothetical protein